MADDLKPADWKQADALYRALAERVDAKLGAADEKTVLAFLSAPENRLDLARLTLLRKAGGDAVQKVAANHLGAEMMAKLGNDLNWMAGLLYAGPTENLGTALEYLAAIYAADDFRLKEPVTRRIATTTALEFAREGWDKEDMLARFKFYNDAWRADKLNAIFDELAYWETRLVTGCSEPGQKVGQWGDPRNLAWLCDNVRLPVERYLGCESHLCYRLRNVAGDSVFSSEYLAPILDYTQNITAWAYREIGGVCGALSHYAAYSALAAGIPAMTLGEPGHCSYTIRVGNEWKLGNSIYWQHSSRRNSGVNPAGISSSSCRTSTRTVSPPRCRTSLPPWRISWRRARRRPPPSAPMMRPWPCSPSTGTPSPATADISSSRPPRTWSAGARSTSM